MTNYALVRLVSGIFYTLETYVVPAVLSLRAWIQTDFLNWLKKLEFPRFSLSPVFRWPAWLQPGTMLHRFLAWFGSFLLDTFVIVSSTAAMLCILYFVW